MTATSRSCAGRRSRRQRWQRMDEIAGMLAAAEAYEEQTPTLYASPEFLAAKHITLESPVDRGAAAKSADITFPGLPEEWPQPVWMDPADVTRGHSYGGIITNDAGEFLLVQPAGRYEGEAWTWPKGGRNSESEDPRAAALREVAEETGHQCVITGYLPKTYTSTWSQTNYYLM